MRMPRFRVRSLMLAVGLVALLIWGTRMGMRSYRYYRYAEYYGVNERGWREMAIRDREDPTRSRSISALYGLQIAEFYAPLARKYRRAMWCPWIPVAPDPPAPVFASSPLPPSATSKP